MYFANLAILLANATVTTIFWRELISLSSESKSRVTTVGYFMLLYVLHSDSDSWWGGPWFVFHCGRPLPTGWIGVSRMWTAETDFKGLPALSHVWQHVKLSDVSLGTVPRYSLVVHEDAKNPNKQTNKALGYFMHTVCSV